MIKIHLSPEDLSEFRFAFSPLWETISSLRVLQDPSRYAFHLRWIGEHRAVLGRLDLAPLLALTLPIQTDGYVPDFLTPPPEGPYPDFYAELERVRSVDHEQLAREVNEAFSGREMPAEARDLLEGPDEALGRLVDALLAYWRSTLEEHWPRIRALLEGDVMYRARAMALGGPEAFFEEMPPGVRYADGLLEIERRWDFETQLRGRGLVLLPLAFATPRAFVTLDEPYQPTFCYPPRGIATLWEQNSGTGRQGALDSLLGGRRVAILRALEVPLSTTDLAERVGVTAAAVSQQLGLLREAGLIDAQRSGSRVYSRLTERGVELLRLFDAA